MLVLERRNQERVFIDTIDGRIEVVITAIRRESVELGFVAPPNVAITRDDAKNTAPRERE